jgi:hypothetical protein
VQAQYAKQLLLRLAQLPHIGFCLTVFVVLLFDWWCINAPNFVPALLLGLRFLLLGFFGFLLLTLIVFGIRALGLLLVYPWLGFR